MFLCLFIKNVGPKLSKDFDLTVPTWITYSQSTNEEVHLQWGSLVLHPSMSFIRTTFSSLPVNPPLNLCRSFSAGVCVYIEHFLQRPPASHSLTLSPFLSCPLLLTVCRIGEAYRLATTIKVQQVSGGSSHHWSKLRKPSCDQRL